MVERGRLKILYHSDLTHAESSRLEEISEKDIEGILALKEGLEDFKRVKKE